MTRVMRMGRLKGNLIFQTTLKWKAALLNKRRERAKPVLSDDDVQLLVKNTYFSEHDIRCVTLYLDSI